MPKSADKRNAILQAAEQAFSAEGYAATTIDQIAAKAGIAKGSVYNYFKSKQDLFLALFTQLLAGDEAEADTLIARAPTPAQKIEALIDMWFKRFEHYRKVGGLFLEFWATAARDQREGGLSATMADMETRWRDKVAGILSQGIESGEFRSDLDCRWAATAFLAMLDGLTIQAIVQTGVSVDGDFIQAIKRELVASFTAGVDRRDRAAGGGNR